MRNSLCHSSGQYKVCYIQQSQQKACGVHQAMGLFSVSHPGFVFVFSTFFGVLFVRIVHMSPCAMTPPVAGIDQ